MKWDGGVKEALDIRFVLALCLTPELRLDVVMGWDVAIEPRDVLAFVLGKLSCFKAGQRSAVNNVEL